MKRLSLLIAGTALALFSGLCLPAAARTLDEVMANVEKTAALKDVRGIQIVKFVVEGEAVTARNHFAAKRPDRFRSETRIPIPGAKSVQKIITVCDGKDIWQYIMGEDRRVIKMNLSSAAGQLKDYKKKFLETGYGVVDAEGLIKMAGADYDIKVAGTAKLNGIDMDVIEGTLKPGSKPASGSALQTPVKIRYLISPKDGFVYKTEGFDKAGKSILEISYEGLKFNTGVADKEFTFTPPKGVEVFDAAEVMPHVAK